MDVFRVWSQINDLRSSIVKSACATICALSRALGDAFEPFANQYVPILWTKTIITIQVTTTAPPPPTHHHHPILVS